MNTLSTANNDILNQIKLSFDNFDFYEEKEKEKLINSIVKFEIEKFPYELRKLVVMNLVEYVGDKINNYGLKEINPFYTLILIFEDLSFVLYLKKYLSEKDLNKLKLLLNDNNLFIEKFENLAMCHKDLAYIFFNFYKNECGYGFSNQEYVDKIINLIEYGVKISDIINLFKDNEKQLSLLDNKFPEAKKYINLM